MMKRVRKGSDLPKKKWGFINESRDTIKSLTLFIIVKTITKLNLGHMDKFETDKNLKNHPSWDRPSARKRRIYSFHVVVL